MLQVRCSSGYETPSKELVRWKNVLILSILFHLVPPLNLDESGEKKESSSEDEDSFFDQAVPLKGRLWSLL